MSSTFSLAPGDWSEQPLAHTGRSDGYGLSIALVASLLLHGVVLLALLYISLMPGKDQGREASARKSIAITLIEDVPLKALPETLPPATDMAETVGIPADRSVTTSPIPVGDDNPPVTSTGSPVAPPESSGQSSRLTDAPPAMDRATTLGMIRSGIAGYIANRQPEVTRGYVEDCIRYRNRYGSNRECPDTFGWGIDANSEEREIVSDLFAINTRDADYARMSRQLERENDLLLGVMAQGGPAAEQAEIRWRLIRQYHAFLNGNGVPELVLRAQTAFVNDYDRTATPAPFQFRCKKLPCVYVFSGFEVKRPATYVQKAPGFVETTPLFVPSKD